VQLLATLGALQVAGTVAASAYQDRELADARARMETAHSAFTAEYSRVLADGTPRELVERVAAEEQATRNAQLPTASFLVDRVRLEAIRTRAQKLTGYSSQLKGVETQVEVQLHQSLVDELKALRDDLKAGTEAGLETAEYAGFAADTEAANQGLSTPAAAAKVIDAVKARHAALKQATATQVAHNRKVQSAQSDVAAALGRAQRALAAAKAIPVLKVDGAAAQVAALAARIPGTIDPAVLEDLASQLGAQADALYALVSARQGAYDLLAAARARMDRAKQGGIDVSNQGPPLDAAAASLDAASDMASVTAARQSIQAVKNEIDVKYNLAVYGPGKVMVISIAQEELQALQDGVVVQDTLVTTGRPSLPTPVGTFSVTAKYSPYHMVSPWPKGDKYYYPPVDLKYAMLWHDGGYFIHDASWRYHYGPGSDTEYGGTHGCINVPYASIGWLYNWAEVGTKVVTLSGSF
jgi:lipoprotein-anchoring transpeptidase ErfK/SrfK